MEEFFVYGHATISSSPCKRKVLAKNSFCWQHDTEIQEPIKDKKFKSNDTTESYQEEDMLPAPSLDHYLKYHAKIRKECNIKDEHDDDVNCICDDCNKKYWNDSKRRLSECEKKRQFFIQYCKSEPESEQ